MASWLHDVEPALQLPSPLQEIHDPLFSERGVRVSVKRDDLIHPLLGGNKWRKLKYNLLAARQRGDRRLLSFGGARSNHIHALAAAGNLYGFETVGVIRGEPRLPLNPTLSFAAAKGMQLYYLDRKTWRRKTDADIQDDLHNRFAPFFQLPEGGSNGVALQGCRELAGEIIAAQDTVDVIAVACGSGGTLAGIAAALDRRVHVQGFSVLKDNGSVRRASQGLLDEAGIRPACHWSINSDYHLGGYAKRTPELLRFIGEFEQRHGIRLDPVYTGKLMLGLYDLVRQGHYPRGTDIVAVHSGGLQGW
jgi:1-aminocyclopropane-1-carboxylate deaminase